MKERVGRDQETGPSGALALPSYGAQVTRFSALQPTETALEYLPDHGSENISMSWRDLDVASTQLARKFQSLGVDRSSTVVVGLSNCPEHVLASIATWKLGGCVVPMNQGLPIPERDALLALADPDLVVSEWRDHAYEALTAADLRSREGLPTDPLPDVVPRPGFAIGSGGSTGRSKLIVNPRPLVVDPTRYPHSLMERAGCRPGQRQLVCGPLYHTLGFVYSMCGLAIGQSIVVMGRFDARRALQLIEERQIQFLAVVPTMMQRLVGELEKVNCDLSSIESVYHAGAACSIALKRSFLRFVDPARVYEAFGATECFGSAEIRGDDWLRHPGSVGQPVQCDLRILDAAGSVAAPRDVGEIFMRPHEAGPTYEYIGAEPARMTDDGFGSVGDLGYVDDEGYLYSVDRRADMIVSGGANVYPAEVEAALAEHERVLDVVVIGLPDDDWGKRVHAIVVTTDHTVQLTDAELDTHVRGRLSAYKAPKSYEFLPQLPRNEAGKIRRSALIAERSQGRTK